MALNERFINGLKNFNLNYEEVKSWKYCGGNKGVDLRYFKTIYKNKPLPDFTNKCVCGHII